MRLVLIIFGIYSFPLKHVIWWLRDVQQFIILDFSIALSGRGVNFCNVFFCQAFDSSPFADLKHDQCQQCRVQLQLISLFTTSRLQGASAAWVCCCVYRCQQEARLHPHHHHVTHTSYTSSSPPLCFHSIPSTQMRRRYSDLFPSQICSSVYYDITICCLKLAFIHKTYILF